VIVTDASVLVVALIDEGDHGEAARDALGAEPLAAPELVDVEVASALRRLASAGSLAPERAARGLADLADLPITRTAHRPLLARCWALRENLTIYDAVYVALAEELGALLLTADQRLARTPGPTCRITLLR
jgi:predicted nucleic acid-binding protein